MSKPLSVLQDVKLAEVDKKTAKLISGGFVYDNKTFSLTLDTQVQLIGMFTVRGEVGVQYPVKWNTIDNKDFVMLNTPAAVKTYYMTAVSRYRSHVDSGTVIKDLIRTATDEAALNLILDLR